MDERARALDVAHRAALDFLEGLDNRPVWPRATIPQLRERFGGPLPDSGEDAANVVTRLAADADDGIVGMPGGRYFGFVVGGTLPAALGADWLVSAWDQNTGSGTMAPAAVALEQTAARWIVDLLRLPEDCSVGFVTGAQMSNLTCLLIAQQAVLRRAGWDIAQRGLRGAPATPMVVGADRHGAIDRAAKLAGIGRDEIVVVDADDEGRMIPAALAAALDPLADVTPIVCLQAGEVHTGAFDPFAELIPIAKRYGAWVHVDGAFGLWAAATPTLRSLVDGLDGADSWSTDGHKTLNVPYDCGIAIVRDPADSIALLRAGGDYLMFGDLDPWDVTPELSRRARGIPVYAALRSLGRDGVAELVDRLHRNAVLLEAGLRAVPGVEVVNEVPYTQVMFRLEDDAATRALGAAILAEGTAALTGAVWHGRAVLRCSMSSWATSADDIRRTVDAIARLAGELTPAG